MTDEAKIIWMTDLHFVREGLVLGHDPRARLDAAVRHVNSHHADADFCVISGDLVNRGTLADYTALRSFLTRLAIPYAVIPGNHDSRAELRQVFAMPRGCMDQFVQYLLPNPACHVLCLDTLKPGADGGQFCTERLDWLRRELAKTRGKSTCIFLHHPPMSLGLPMQDQDRLADAEALLALLSAQTDPVHLFIGHVHRPICGVVAGIPYATMRSILYQAPAPRPEWDWTTFAPAQEAPNLGVIRVSGRAITLQYEQFCELTVGT